MTYFLRTDGSSFSDPEGVPGGGPGPALDFDDGFAILWKGQLPFQLLVQSSEIMKELSFLFFKTKKYEKSHLILSRLGKLAKAILQSQPHCLRQLFFYGFFSDTFLNFRHYQVCRMI